MIYGGRVLITILGWSLGIITVTALALVVWMIYKLIVEEW